MKTKDKLNKKQKNAKTDFFFALEEYAFPYGVEEKKSEGELWVFLSLLSYR